MFLKLILYILFCKRKYMFENFSRNEKLKIKLGNVNFKIENNVCMYIFFRCV